MEAGWVSEVAVTIVGDEAKVGHEMGNWAVFICVAVIGQGKNLKYMSFALPYGTPVSQ